MTNLETIVLDSNQISNITSSCFDGLYNLKSLSLNGNPVREVMAGAWKGLHQTLALI